MSISIINSVRADHEVSGSRKLVLMTVASYLWEKRPDRGTNVSTATIALDTGLSQRSVQRHLDSLVAMGKLVWDKGRGLLKVLVAKATSVSRQATPVSSAPYIQAKPSKNSDPAGRRRENRMIGELPPDEPVVVRPRATFADTVTHFDRRARAMRSQGDLSRTRRVVKTLRDEHGLDYHQIQRLFDMFFTKHAVQISDKRRQYTAISMFQQMLQRLVNDFKLNHKGQPSNIGIKTDFAEEIAQWKAAQSG